MRQRVFKMVVCIVLAVSVFLCSGGVAYADEETDETNYDIELYADELGKFDGSCSFNASNPRIITNVDSVNSPYVYKSSDQVHLLGRLTMELDAGHTYNGYVDVSCSYTATVSGSSSISYFRCAPSSYFVSGTGWYSFIPYTVDAIMSTDGSLVFNMRVYFTDFVVSQTANYSFPIYASFNSYIYSQASTDAVFIQFSSGNWSVSNDLYDTLSAEDGGSVQYEVNQQTVIMEGIAREEMEQQQQIADQQAAQQESIAAAQASQSAQQHDDLINGYQDDSYNSQVSDAGDQIDAYIDQESALMADQQAQISDYAGENFNTGLINTYLPAVTAVGSWYTQIWNSFGQLNSAFVVILALGIASFLIGLKRR